MKKLKVYSKTISDNWKPFKNESSFRSWDIYIFVPIGYVEKWFYKTAELNFEIYDVTYWTTNNYNTYILQNLKK